MSHFRQIQFLGSLFLTFCHVESLFDAFFGYGKLSMQLHSKLDSKRTSGKSERWRRSSAGCERVQALAGEKRAKMLGESDRERKLHDTSITALAGKKSGESFSRAFEKTRRGL